MKIVNRRAHFNFEILDKFEAGINLTGAETKSIKLGRLQLDFAFVKIIGSEAYLVNAEIPLYPYAREVGYDSKRTRKLLLHKKEILVLKTKMSQFGLTVVPLSCYTKHGFVKMELALAKGKKAKDKREEIRKRDINRQVERDLRGKI